MKDGKGNFWCSWCGETIVPVTKAPHYCSTVCARHDLVDAVASQDHPRIERARNNLYTRQAADRRRGVLA